MPVLAVQHEAQPFGVGLGLFDRFLVDALFFGAAFVVQGGQGLGKLGGLVVRGREQHVMGQRGAAQTPGGVDARGEVEDHLARAEGRHGGKTAGPLEFGEAGAFGLRNFEQAVFDEDAVLPRERNHVRQRAEGHEIQHLPHVHALARHGFQPAVEGGHKEEGHAHARQMRAGVVFAEARVGDRVGWRQLGWRHVVVGHHHHKAQLPGPFHGLHIADAAVHGQQDARPFLGGEAFDFRDVEAVALLPPVREVYRRGHVMEAEGLQDERSAGDAVHVVVAPDEDFAPFPDALFQRIGRFPHAGPAVRGREVAQPRREERIHLGGSFQPALPEQVGYDLRDAQLVRPSGGAGALIGLVAEFPYFHIDIGVLVVELGGGGGNFL